MIVYFTLFVSFAYKNEKEGKSRAGLRQKNGEQDNVGKENYGTDAGNQTVRVGTVAGSPVAAEYFLS